MYGSVGVSCRHNDKSKKSWLGLYLTPIEAVTSGYVPQPGMGGNQRGNRAHRGPGCILYVPRGMSAFAEWPRVGRGGGVSRALNKFFFVINFGDKSRYQPKNFHKQFFFLTPYRWPVMVNSSKNKVRYLTVTCLINLCAMRITKCVLHIVSSNMLRVDTEACWRLVLRWRVQTECCAEATQTEIDFRVCLKFPCLTRVLGPP